MATEAQNPPGFVSSFRVLGDSLLASVQDRLGLISLEFQEEKFRLIQIFFWISAAMFAGVMAITFASLTLIYVFWGSARLAALGTATVFYLGALVAIVFGFRRYLKRQPRPFAASLQEITEDRACLKTKS